MTSKEFNKILENRIDEIKKTLMKKAKEYSNNDDRLYNFYRAGKILNIKPEQALFGMFVKHLVSVIDLVEKNIEPTEFLINEKIGDSVNYLILLEAILKENINKI